MRSNEENFGLLEECDVSRSSGEIDEKETASYPEIHAPRSALRYGRHICQHRPWKRLLGLAIALFTTSLLIYITLWRFPPRGVNSDAEPQLAISLHPEAHTLREKTTLSFEWNVTRGMRSPDGVEKLVYLINGLSNLFLSLGPFAKKEKCR